MNLLIPCWFLYLAYARATNNREDHEQCLMCFDRSPGPSETSLEYFIYPHGEKPDNCKMEKCCNIAYKLHLDCFISYLYQEFRGVEDDINFYCIFSSKDCSESISESFRKEMYDLVEEQGEGDAANNLLLWLTRLESSSMLSTLVKRHLVMDIPDILRIIDAVNENELLKQKFEEILQNKSILSIFLPKNIKLLKGGGRIDNSIEDCDIVKAAEVFNNYKSSHSRLALRVLTHILWRNAGLSNLLSNALDEEARRQIASSSIIEYILSEKLALPLDFADRGFLPSEDFYDRYRKYIQDAVKPPYEPSEQDINFLLPGVLWLLFSRDRPVDALPVDEVFLRVIEDLRSSIDFMIAHNLECSFITMFIMSRWCVRAYAKDRNPFIHQTSNTFLRDFFEKMPKERFQDLLNDVLFQDGMLYCIANFRQGVLDIVCDTILSHAEYDVQFFDNIRILADKSYFRCYPQIVKRLFYAIRMNKRLNNLVIIKKYLDYFFKGHSKRNLMVHDLQFLNDLKREAEIYFDFELTGIFNRSVRSRI